MVKFTKAQIEFIKSKFVEKEVFFDEDRFAKEAEEFTPIKKRDYKEVPDVERCTATKKDGERCTKKAQKDKTTCGVHSKTTEERKAIAEKAKANRKAKKEAVSSDEETEIEVTKGVISLEA